MWATLIGKINTTLGNVTEVAEYFSVPKSKIDSYPAVFFKPFGFNNTFENSQENFQIYRFIMIVIIGASEDKTLTDIFTTTLPATVDAIIEQFDQDWDGGTNDGHRITVKIDSADEWQVDDEQDGLVAYAPLNVEIKVLSTN